MEHTHLAIIDLSNRGVQQKFSLNKDVILMYNGEITVIQLLVGG
jgi:asparagine synthetase B (glutamine-hydrolysing)